MAKRSSDNQDYYKLRGGEVGRRTYASERQKLKQGAVSPRVGKGEKLPTEADRPAAVDARGAGAQTARKGKKRQTEKALKESEEEGRAQVVERAAEAQAPSASPDRMLPPAALSTEVADFVRHIREDLGAAQRASRELAASLADLARTPVRLVRLLRAVRAS